MSYLNRNVFCKELVTIVLLLSNNPWACKVNKTQILLKSVKHPRKLTKTHETTGLPKRSALRVVIIIHTCNSYEDCEAEADQKDHED